MQEMEPRQLRTILAQVGCDHPDPAGAISVPIYSAAVYRHPGLGQSTGYDYFSVKYPHLVPQVLGRVRLIAFAESLGGVESLMTFPAVQTHADVPVEIRERLGVNDRLLRLSVGIEAVEDLISDLEQALANET